VNGAYKRPVYGIYDFAIDFIFHRAKRSNKLHIFTKMSNSLSGKIFNFLTTSPLEHITAFSVIFQAMEEEPLIKQDALRNIVNNAVNLATNTYSNNILAQNKLLMVSMQVC
jgi:hypothetical protein